MTADPLRRRVIEIPGKYHPPGWMITPRSRLVSRFGTDCERIFLPGFQANSVKLEISAEPEARFSRAAKKRRRRILDIFSSASEQSVDDLSIFDMRKGNPFNWMHILNGQLAYFFFIHQQLGLEWSESVAVLPEAAPSYIKNVVELFGIKTLCTDKDLVGRGIHYAPKPWRFGNLDFVRTERVRQALEDAGVFDPAARPLPQKVFLSRKDSRKLINEAEIEALLAERGFEKLYPEELPIADQLRLLMNADDVVAIHGAALGPLIYRQPEAPQIRLLELFPCGHMTGVFRSVNQQLGGRWVGVRGHIRPEHIRNGAYDLKNPFLRYSQQDFTVDPKSVRIALSILADDVDALPNRF